MDRVFYNFGVYSECFLFEYITASFSRVGKFTHLLQTLIARGVFLQISNKCLEQIFKYISSYPDQSLKKDIEEALEVLRNRNRIYVCHTTDDISLSNWENEIDTFNLDYIFSTNRYQKIDDIHSTLFSSGAIVNNQTEQFINQNLKTILPFVQEVILIDPYFDINKDRFYKTLKIVNDLLNQNCNEVIEKNILIHTSNKSRNIQREVDHNLINWKNKLNILNSSHRIKIAIWDDNRRWHDRYVITELGGISVGRGLDIHDNSESTWDILEYEEISKRLNPFEENNPNAYKLIKILNNY